eukprot:PhF_6_TR44237/c0_g1_i1/m.68012
MLFTNASCSVLLIFMLLLLLTDVATLAHDHKSIFISFHISSHELCHPTLLDVRYSKALVSPTFTLEHFENPSFDVVVSYVVDEHSQGQRMQGWFQYNESSPPGIITTYIDPSVKVFNVTCVVAGMKNTTTTITLHDIPYTVPTNHFFRPQAQGGTVESGTFQYRGPVNTQINFIFLSSGYKAEEKSKFIQEAKDTWGFIQDPSKTRGLSLDNTFYRETSPYTRYAGFTNVFYVFEPSKESGAGLTCPGSVANSKNNLLCCFENAKAKNPSCNQFLVQSLADQSGINPKDYPDRTCIIVLVNHFQYGGTGTWSQSLHIGVFSNYFFQYQPDTAISKTKMASLVMHEMSHAFVRLLDEYDIGRPEYKPTASYPNCYISDDAKTLPWKHWLDPANAALVRKARKGLPDSDSSTFSYTVLQKPEKICGYNNFFKSGSKGMCLMGKLDSYYFCPVCREAITMQIITQPTTTISFGQHRCPPLGYIPVLFPGESMTLELNPALSAANEFEIVEWKLTSAILGGDVGDATLSGCPLIDKRCKKFVSKTPGTFRVVVDIQHDSSWVVHPKESNRDRWPWKQNTTFIIRVLDSTYTTMPTSLGPNMTVRRAYCGGNRSLDEGVPLPFDDYSYYCEGNCTDPYAGVKLSTYLAPPVPGFKVSELGSMFYFIVGGMCLLCAGLWGGTVYRYRIKNKQSARPIFTTQYSNVVGYIRLIMKTTAIFLMFLAFGCILFGLAICNSMGSVGIIILMIAAVTAFLFYILGFVGYWAVENRSLKILLLNGIMLILSLGCQMGWLIIIQELREAVSDQNDKYSQRFEDLWTYFVAKQTDFTCQVQLYYECTGFYYSCDSIQATSEECPAQCSINSQSYPACQAVLKHYISGYAETWLYIVVTIVIGNIYAVMFNFMLYYETRVHKLRLEAQMQARLDEIARAKPNLNPDLRAIFLLKTLSDKDTEKLVKQFHKIDLDGSGALDKFEFFSFFQKSLLYRPTEREMDVLFDIADTSGDGSIGLSEFLAIFAPKHIVEKQQEEEKTLRMTRGGGLSPRNATLKKSLSGDTMAQSMMARFLDGSSSGGQKSPKSMNLNFSFEMKDTLSGTAVKLQPESTISVFDDIQARIDKVAQQYEEARLSPRNKSLEDAPP